MQKFVRRTELYRRQQRDEKEKEPETGGNKAPYRRNKDDLRSIGCRRILLITEEGICQIGKQHTLTVPPLKNA